MQRPASPPSPAGQSPTWQPGAEHATAAPHAAPVEEEVLYHIPCPNGHDLETPADMLGQDVLCPHCNVQFRLREKDSVEYRRKRQEEMARHERKLSSTWLNWAIVAAVLVVLALLLLILSGTSG